ncbi:Membrane dipeptidase (Peptidase family M19) [Pseudovibrio axinellae]|uniref:Membrane dipeptidase (Peptidase family M19) n=1 Tax=Pseudovibrio axinellae TaxID=989403 RepID=A0A165YNT3_9HYPH|nr:dipeptidase [Pseudovibrio axinellae]KZL19021.1 Membrane dipeptidase (Peptidase family M19) [Pseudovibrio axinellae]SEP83552.1 dipeptidase AC. Metallo peptidase. MEROPS family M19 [Pseudovibrio axinellae]
MTDTAPHLVPVFDGHNDTLLSLERRSNTPKERSFFEAANYDHIDLPRARQGGFAGGLFAMFTPSQLKKPKEGEERDFSSPENFVSITQSSAFDYTMKLADIAYEVEATSDGEVRICRSTSDIKSAMADDKLAMMLHVEGAECIDKDFEALELLYNRGLRSLGPVWSRETIFGHGVPMQYEQTPDIGPGLTDLGKELVRQCNQRRIQLDVSHLNEKGFWDLARITDNPIVASHSNVYSICPVSRNLTNKQLDAIAESKGLVGINFAVFFLRPDGRMDPDMPLDVILRHADHLINKLGEDGVAIGSDYDGCLVANDIKDVTGLPKLIEAFRKADFGEELIAKIAHKNWISVLERAGI